MAKKRGPRRIGPEEKLQRWVVEYFETFGIAFLHIPNGRHAPKSAGVWKALGVKRGAPDLLIFDPFDADPLTLPWRLARRTFEPEDERRSAWIGAEVPHTLYGDDDSVDILGGVSFVGIAMELKAPKAPKKIPEHQEAWLELLRRRGWFVCVCRTPEDVRAIVRACYRKDL